MVEIIPQKSSKRLGFSFYLAICLLFFFLIGYFAFNGILRNTRNQITLLESELEKKMSPEEILIEKEILSAKDKIEKFSYLIKEHVEASNVFGIVEENCHPQVWFSSFGFDSGKGQIVISGEAQSFRVLGQQTLILKEEERIEKVDLNKIAISKEGRISFDFLVLLKPSVFK